MILSFKPQFKENILSGDKIHTIRKNGNRWNTGRKIHFATGVRTKNYDCFKVGECIGFQRIFISSFHDAIFIDGREIGDDEKRVLAKNDGFKYVCEFYDWFDKDFHGVIIHWTDYIY